MLTEKPWRLEAVTQLLLGAFLCFMVSALWLAMSADPQGTVTLVTKVPSS